MSSTQLFLSYAWANKEIADQIDNDFKAIGISFIRDIRDAQYKKSLKEFMSRVRKADYIVMLISDAFLKSINCMYEVMELFKDNNFSNRLLQVILSDANVFTPSGRLEYIKYWNEEYESLNKQLTGLPVKSISSSGDDIRHLDNICNNIDAFLGVVSSENSVPFSVLKANNYKDLLNYIGFTETELLYRLLAISRISDSIERNIAIDDFLYKNPDEYLGHYLKANFETGKEAISSYNRAIELNPTFADAYNNRGNLLSDMDNKEEAEQDYNKAIDLNPENADFYLNRGLLYQGMNKIEYARNDIETAITLSPEYARSYYIKGNLLSDLGKREEAESSYKKAIELNPEYEVIYNNKIARAFYKRGNLSVTQGKKEEAEQCFTKAIEMNPDFADAYYNRGLVLSTLGRTKEAEIDFFRALELNPALNNELSEILDKIRSKKIL